MSLEQILKRTHTIFLDTAPFVYFIESHPAYGSLARQVFDLLGSGQLQGYASVLTLSEVLVKPMELGNEPLAHKFSQFLKYGKNLSLLEISAEIAERAGGLRGKYKTIKTIDALQVSTALEINADLFLTNDAALKRIKEIKVVVLKDYL